MWYKRRHYSVLLGIVLVTLLALLIGCSSNPTTTAPTTSAPTTSPVSSGGTVELRLAHAWANTHHVHKAIEAWAQEVNQATDGRVKITIYPGGALSTAAQLYDTAATGVADMS